MKNNNTPIHIAVNAQILFTILVVFWLVGFRWADVPSAAKLPAIGLLLGASGTICLTVDHLLFQGMAPFSSFATKAILVMDVLLGVSATAFCFLSDAPILGVLGLAFAVYSMRRCYTMMKGEV